MKVAVVGSRTFDDFGLLSETLSKIEDIDLVITGGARGTDSLAERWAIENKKPVRIYAPDWKKFGRGAGIIRNREIINNCDIVYAFWDGKSKGTKFAIEYAEKQKKKVTIIEIK